MLEPLNRYQSPTSTARPSAVRFEMPRRQLSRSATGGELGVRGQCGDRGCRASHGVQRSRGCLVVGIERGTGAGLVETDRSKPRVMGAAPSLAAVVDVAAT